MEPLDFDAVARSWSRWSPTFERGAGAVSGALVREARIRPGDRILDLATGVGEPALPAARAAAPGGSVVGIDVSPAMLALARERAERAGITNVTFVCADIGDYVGEERFDAIVSRWGLMFVSDLDAALRRLREYLRDGGRFAAAVWGAPAEVPMIAVPLELAAQRFPELASPPAGGPFALHDAARLQQRFRDCGYRDVAASELSVAFPFASASEYFEHISEVAPPVVTLLRRLGAERATAFRAAVEEIVAARFTTPDGIRIPNRVIVVRADRGDA